MGWAIWISGSASSGRSGLARAAAAELHGQDRAIAVQEVLFVAERLHRRGAGERSPSQTAPS